MGMGAVPRYTFIPSEVGLKAAVSSQRRCADVESHPMKGLFIQSNLYRYNFLFHPLDGAMISVVQ